jgi:hypothetical protein
VHRIRDGFHYYSTARTWAQTTIIPTNKVIDASAAAFLDDSAKHDASPFVMNIEGT